MMRNTTALLIIATLAFPPYMNAAIYTDQRDPSYESASIALFCMNHFFNHTRGRLGQRAGFAAQSDLAERLPTLPDGEKLADELRLSLVSMARNEGSKAVPPHCWQYIPKDHGLTSEEFKYFLKHSSEE